MQSAEYFFSQQAADTGDAGKLLNPGLAHALQAAKVIQQGASAPGANSWYAFQFGPGCRLLPLTAMPGDGETMRFITNLLDQV